MDCIWIPLVGDAGYWTCSNCARPYTMRFAVAEKPIAKRNCIGEPRIHPCKHLGEFKRKQECLTCQGNVQVKVFSCAIHGECTLGKVLPGIKCCSLGGTDACTEYVASSGQNEE